MFEEYTDDLQTIECFPDGKVFRIIFDACVRKFKLLCKRYDMLEEVQDAFSAPNPASFFVRQYGYKTEAKVYVVNKFGYFAPGLLFDVLKWIKETYGDLSCVIMSAACKKYITDFLTPLKADIAKYKLDFETFQLANIADDLGRNNELIRNGKDAYLYRDYQENAVKSLIFRGMGRGLIEIPTAGGKSFILANFIWNLHKSFCKEWRYLILVPNKQLVVQFYKDLIDYGYDPGKITQFTAGLKGKEAFNPAAQVIVANRQYLFKNKAKLPKIDVLICDEVHQCLSEASAEFIETLNCKLKVGCSGTIPRDKYQRWRIQGLFSKVVYQEDITTLQDHGYISKLKITLLKITDSVVEGNRKLLFHENSEIKYRPDEFGNCDILFDDAYKAEHEYFEKHYRDLYQPVFDYLLGLPENTLILFDRIEIGQSLFELAKELYAGKKNVFYIDGSININDRENVRSEFEKNDGNLLIAQSSILSTGVNIKRLGVLVLLTSSKAFSRTIQSIGRTLRLHKSKTVSQLIDVSWNFKYSQRHCQERLRIYKQMYNLDPETTIHIKI